MTPDDRVHRPKGKAASPRALPPVSFRSCKSAFAEGLFRDAIDPVAQGIGADELASTADAAWKRRDRPAFIAAARALRASGALRDKRASRLARALLDVDLAEEALDVLVDPAIDAGEASFDQTLLLALAWLRLGATHRGTAAVRDAQALAGDDRQKAEAATLAAGLEACKATGGPTSWTETCALTEALLDLRQAELACGVLRARLELQGAPAGEALAPMLDCAFAAFRTARAGPAKALFAAMAPLYRAAGDREAFLAAMAALDGEAVDVPPPPDPPDPLVQKLHACLAAALAGAGRWGDAVGRYRVTAGSKGMLALVMSELARCVGRDVADGVDLAFQPPGPRRKIFDVFPFNGEFAMLELKFAEMGGWVDQFVIVEARKTFTGLPKPLRFPERAAAFDAYKDKIVYLAVDDFPPHVASAWAREFFQRDQGVLGLKGRCSPDDIVIISDADEIIRREAVEGFEGLLAGADLETFKYFFNYEHTAPYPLIKAVFARVRLLARNGCSHLRIGGGQHFGHTYVPKAGWHFTHIAAPEALESKFRSFSHEEYGHLDRAYFEDLIEKIRTEGLGRAYRRRPLEEMPDCIRSRRDALSEWLL